MNSRGSILDLPRDLESSTTISELLEFCVARHSTGSVFCRLADTGEWLETAWDSFWNDVLNLRGSFEKSGLTKGDRIAILAGTCQQWVTAEMAGLLAGCVIVGVDTQASKAQINFVLRHSEAKALLVDDVEKLAHIEQPVIDNLRCSILLNGQSANGSAYEWDEFLQFGSNIVPDPRNTPGPSDPAWLVFTSGTTGPPKGILYTHEQVLVACKSIIQEFSRIPDQGSMICWLPMAFLFQRMMNLVGMVQGLCTHFVEDPRNVVDRMHRIEPCVFTAVPRFYEKLYDGIQSRLERQNRLLRRMTGRAIRVGKKLSKFQRGLGEASPWLRFEHRCWDFLVLKRIRSVIGNKMQFMISGSAPMPVWLLEFFHGCGVLILEAYGLSENIVPMAANRPDDFRFGSVGKPFCVNELKLAPDGEITVRGPGVFGGYYHDPETPNRIDDEGFYHSGDYGDLADDGFVYLQGRKTDIIKTSSGHRISPQAVEAVYSETPYIDQIVVVGNRRKHLAALVWPNVVAVRDQLRRSGINPPKTDEELVDSQIVRQMIEAELKDRSGLLSRHERVFSFSLLSKPLSLANGDITTSLKLRRNRIEANYANLIDSLYDSSVNPLSAAG